MKRRLQLVVFWFALLTCTLPLITCSWQPVNPPAATGFQSIDAQQLLAILDDPEWLVVDIRDSNAYNGWRLGKAVRGGCIPGAENLDLDWVLANPGTYGALLESKGITPGRRLVIYGEGPSDGAQGAEWFRRHSWSPGWEIYLYAEGIAEWSENPDLPLERLPRYEKLVYPGWVNRLIQGQNPETYQGNPFRIVEAAWQGEQDYVDGHIPGAVYLDTEELESPPLWNIVSPEELRDALLLKGITTNSLVVVYGKDTHAAARAATAMMYLGVRDTRLLNGGFQAWMAERLPTEGGHVRSLPSGDFGVPVPQHPEYVIVTEEARTILQNSSARLISVRSWAEFIGATSGYSFIEPKGRIPGALWGYSGSGPGKMQEYLNPDNTMRSAREIGLWWRRVGITPNRELSFYCGTGWRASQVFFYAYVMGFPRISIYDGGWLEWSRDPNNPIARGDPKTPVTGLASDR